MNKELEALDSIRKVIKEVLHFPLNITKEYQIVQQALNRLEQIEAIRRTHGK